MGLYVITTSFYVMGPAHSWDLVSWIQSLWILRNNYVQKKVGHHARDGESRVGYCGPSLRTHCLNLFHNTGYTGQYLQ